MSLPQPLTRTAQITTTRQLVEEQACIVRWSLSSFISRRLAWAAKKAWSGCSGTLSRRLDGSRAVYTPAACQATDETGQIISEQVLPWEHSKLGRIGHACHSRI